MKKLLESTHTLVLERKEKNNQQVSSPAEKVQQKALHFIKPSQAPLKSGSGLFLEMAQVTPTAEVIMVVTSPASHIMQIVNDY